MGNTMAIWNGILAVWNGKLVSNQTHANKDLEQSAIWVYILSRVCLVYSQFAQLSLMEFIEFVYRSNPFSSRWSRWYICTAFYCHYEIRSINLSHCCIIFCGFWGIGPSHSVSFLMSIRESRVFASFPLSQSSQWVGTLHHENMVRHAVRTIVSWPKPKQWLLILTSDLMVIIR